jgi:cleavage and polyadenylation specificity factor subunit 1
LRCHFDDRFDFQVYIWLFKDNDLQGISFLDMHFYVHQLIGMRNLALAADLYRSVALLRYQEDCKALSLASRDLRPIPQQAVPMGVEFIVDNSQLAFLMSDESGIISVFTYQPEAKESLGGQRLVLRADMHIGTRVTQFVRVRGKWCLLSKYANIGVYRSCRQWNG